MRSQIRSGSHREAGFSMVEMLMAAFILAIGLLGLSMLQTMSLRAARGGQNLGVAVHLAEQILDQVELEGRVTYLNSNLTNYTAPTALAGLGYIDQASRDLYFDIDSSTGQLVTAAAPASALFHAQMTQIVVAGTGLSDVTVQVTFADTVDATTHLPIQRVATISRRILHG